MAINRVKLGVKLHAYNGVNGVQNSGFPSSAYFLRLNKYFYRKKYRFNLSFKLAESHLICIPVVSLYDYSEWNDSSSEA